MSNVLPPLNWLRTFEAAARHGSFAAAAGEVSLTPAAVSYQIRSLEASLGFKLFERLPRGLRLTDIGRAYLPTLSKAFDEIGMSTVGLFGGQGRAALTIRASVTYANLLLPQRLPDFHARYPGIDIRLFSTVWSDRSENHDADLEIRYGEGNWIGWRSMRLDSDTSILVSVGSRDTDEGEAAYLKRQISHGVIQIMGCEDLWTRLCRHYEIDEDIRHARLLADNSSTALEMASAGLGALIVSRAFAEPYLRSGRLQQPVDAELDSSSGHYVLVPATRQARRPEALLFQRWLCRDDSK